jgi:hypothetical protein
MIRIAWPRATAAFFLPRQAVRRRVGPMAAEAGNQGITAGLQLRLRERVGCSTEQGRHFDGR